MAQPDSRMASAITADRTARPRRREDCRMGRFLEDGAVTIAAPAHLGSKQRELIADRKGTAPEGAAKFNHAQCTNCRASATSTESPSWFRTSSPDSGTSPEVDCDTMIFLAINPRQVICEELA